MDDKKAQIAVVGAGVNGLSTALCLKETYGEQLDITVIADKFTPNTTSDRAGVFLFNSFDEPRVEAEMKYGTYTFRRLEQIYNSPARSESGLKVFTLYNTFYKKVSPPAWSEDYCYDFQVLSKSEAREKGLRVDQFETICSFGTFLMPGMKYLPWMTKVFCSLGGQVENRKIESFDELKSYDTVINCTGLGSCTLTSDTALYPTRGQMIIANAPNYQRGIYCGDRSNLLMSLPYDDGKIRLGGTHEKHNWSTVPDPDTSIDIHKRCMAVDSELEGAEIIESYACLRPSRHEVRLEAEELESGLTVIHNYGHTCNGYVFSWGCALEVADRLQESLQKKGFQKLQPMKKL